MLGSTIVPPTTAPGTSSPSTTIGVRVLSSSSEAPTQSASGRLPRTGADNIAAAVRIGVVLLVLGFLVYLVGRNRRAARAEG